MQPATGTVTGMTASSRPPSFAAGLLLIAALVVVFVGLQVTGDERVKVADQSSPRQAFKTIEYAGVHIDIPSAWHRVDTGGCGLQSERWARPDSAPCAFEEGASFYGSASFDSLTPPGVRRSTGNGATAWDGYTRRGAFAIYVSAGNRELVRDVLASAQETEQPG